MTISINAGWVLPALWILAAISISFLIFAGFVAYLVSPIIRELVEPIVREVVGKPKTPRLGECKAN